MLDLKYNQELIRFLILVRKEVYRAKGLFPSNTHQLAAFSEEAGEVPQAFIDYDTGKRGFDGIEEETVQAAAMAARLFIEGDASFKHGATA